MSPAPTAWKVKVAVLESRIEFLEKALDQAIEATGMRRYVVVGTEPTFITDIAPSWFPTEEADSTAVSEEEEFYVVHDVPRWHLVRHISHQLHQHTSALLDREYERPAPLKWH